VLPAPARLRARADFATTVRLGRRGRSPLVVTHLVTPDLSRAGSVGPLDPAPPARAGFVVSRAVGGSVVRNQVKRRLRALTAARLPALPSGSALVVRALPASATASSPDLGRALDRAIEQARRTPARMTGRGR